MIFLISASSVAALVFDLPCVCKHTDAQGKQRKARVRNIFISLEKNTIFNEHPVLFIRVFQDSEFSMSYSDSNTVKEEVEGADSKKSFFGLW